jgi:hypothetical protein
LNGQEKPMIKKTLLIGVCAAVGGGALVGCRIEDRPDTIIREERTITPPATERIREERVVTPPGPGTTGGNGTTTTTTTG